MIAGSKSRRLLWAFRWTAQFFDPLQAVNGVLGLPRYFRDYDECVSNDFVLSGGGRDIELLRSDIDDWRITFVDTGLTANIGERLLAVRRHLQDEEAFLVNYADGVSDRVDLDYQVSYDGESPGSTARHSHSVRR